MNNAEAKGVDRLCGAVCGEEGCVAALPCHHSAADQSRSLIVSPKVLWSRVSAVLQAFQCINTETLRCAAQVRSLRHSESWATFVIRSAGEAVAVLAGFGNNKGQGLMHTFCCCSYARAGTASVQYLDVDNLRVQ